jgi:Na+/proline symporter
MGVCQRFMNKKEIESSKLTASFLLWIGAFVLLLFAVLAHFVWKLF